MSQFNVAAMLNKSVFDEDVTVLQPRVDKTAVADVSLFGGFTILQIFFFE